MKKVLLTAAALGLAMAYTASNASAMTFTMGGKFNLTGIYLNNGDGSSAGFESGVLEDGSNDNVDGWHQSVYTYPKLVINDQTSVQGELRFIDRQIWGDGHSGGDEEMRVFKLWANWKSPVGTISFGRMPGGTWGSKFLNSTRNGDRLKWSNTFGAFSAVALYEKADENDAYAGWTDERDEARYLAGVGFGNDMGKTDIAVWHTISDEDDNDFSNTELWFNGSYSFGAIGLNTEAKYVLGEDDNQDDISSFAAMVDASTKIDAFTAGLLFLYATGDDDENDDDNEGYAFRSGVGNDYNPFLLATGDYFGLFNADKNGFLSALDWSSNVSGNDGNGNTPGIIALALYGVFPINDALTANAAIGHIWAEADYGFDNKVGWEVDFGLSYKLVSNLVYSASIGYLNAGAMLDDYADAFGYDGAQNVFGIVQSLTMTW